MPIRIRQPTSSGRAGGRRGQRRALPRPRLVQPHPLQHVPVFRMPGDARRQTVGDQLGQRPDPLVQRAPPRAPAPAADRRATHTRHPVRTTARPRRAARRCAARAAPARPASGSGHRRSPPPPPGRRGPGRPAAAPPHRPAAGPAARRTPGAVPPWVGRISIPRTSRKARNRLYTPSGLSRSMTVVIGQPVAATQAPAASQLPACGSATTAPRPAATSAASSSAPSSRKPDRICARLSDGQPERLHPVPGVRAQTRA